MLRCPFCNQPMLGVDEEEHDPYTDLFRCGACQIEQAVHWGIGESVLASTEDPEDSIVEG